jgi:hypothetical protein
MRIIDKILKINIILFNPYWIIYNSFILKKKNDD